MGPPESQYSTLLAIGAKAAWKWLVDFTATMRLSSNVTPWAVNRSRPSACVRLEISTTSMPSMAMVAQSPSGTLASTKVW